MVLVQSNIEHKRIEIDEREEKKKKKKVLVSVYLVPSEHFRNVVEGIINGNYIDFWNIFILAHELF